MEVRGEAWLTPMPPSLYFDIRLVIKYKTKAYRNIVKKKKGKE